MINIKKFEHFNEEETYIIENRYKYTTLSLYNVMKYLKIEKDNNFNKYNNEYNVNIIDFLKEIFLDKYISFNCIPVKKDSKNKIKGIVKDIKIFEPNNTNFYIEINIHDILKREKDTWYLMQYFPIISVYNYNANNKSLHQKIKIRKELYKETQKYNL